MDVRAPIEFQKGAFPHAVNLPLMNDEERHEVGVCYKRHGQDAAFALGHKLVSGNIRAERVAAWAQFAQAHPGGYLYCFRGGQRSRIAQEWLSEELGFRYPRVLGGYKAMRTYLIETIEQAVAECDITVLGGMTGTGKTEVLHQLDNSLDLEAYAHHRGSSFGSHAHAQPSQIDFENRLAIEILRKRHLGHSALVVEDESRIIGSRNLPLSLYQNMQSRPMVWLEDTLSNRIERILKDYVIDLRAEYVAMFGPDQGPNKYALRLRQNLDNIMRRLGGERHQRLAATMDAALEEQARSGSCERHREWIAGLLVHYYDPMYVYQRERKSSRIVFTGHHQDVVDYLRRQARHGGPTPRQAVA